MTLIRISFFRVLSSLFLTLFVLGLSSPADARAVNACAAIFTATNDIVVEKWAHELLTEGDTKIFWRYEAEPRATTADVIRATVDFRSYLSEFKSKPHYQVALSALLMDIYRKGDLAKTERFFQANVEWAQFSTTDVKDDDSEAFASDVINTNWFRDSEGEAVLVGSSAFPIRLYPTRGGMSSEVTRFCVRGRTYYFRAIGNGKNKDAARKTLAASTLNDLLHQTVVPLSQKIVVNGNAGVLSAAAKGRPRLIRPYSFEKSVRPDNLANTLAFEYLVGNLDLHKSNIAYKDEGFWKPITIDVFDHDHAFTIATMWYLEHAYGTRNLPMRYTKDFITNLKLLSDDDIHAKFKTLLTPLEIDGVIFRRALLLKDIELRPEAVLP